MVKELDFIINVSEFQLWSGYYISLRTNTHGQDRNPVIPRAMGEAVSMLLIYKDRFGIK